MAAPLLLVVDDNKENRTHLARRLARDGYQVITADSGRAALETLDYQPVALILLDLQMPDMDGLQVLEELRKEHTEVELPVLMVSANTDTPTKVAAMDLGANDYLHKPVDYDFLLAKIRQSLRSRESGNHGGKAAPSTLAPQLEVGEEVGHYTLLALLGSGGMGKVFRARDERLLREVALKIMSGEMQPTSRQRFLNEARAVARVTHPNVVTIYEISESPVPYIAMELVQGRELESLITSESIDVQRACDWTIQIADALEAVHQRGILHRDLKPSNVMIGDDGRVRVMDFGLAKIAELDQNITRTGDIWGTPQFMAPEHFDSEFGEVDSRSDIFALCGIFYQMLSGKPPFPSTHMSALIYEILSKAPAPLNVETNLAAACLKGLQKQKCDRYDSAGALARELRALTCP